MDSFGVIRADIPVSSDTVAETHRLSKRIRIFPLRCITRTAYKFVVFAQKSCVQFFVLRKGSLDTGKIILAAYFQKRRGVIVQNRDLTFLTFFKLADNTVVRYEIYVLIHVHEDTAEPFGVVGLPAVKVRPVQFALVLDAKMYIQPFRAAVGKFVYAVHNMREVIYVDKIREKQRFLIDHAVIISYHRQRNTAGNTDADIYTIIFFQDSEQIEHQNTFFTFTRRNIA